MKRVFTIAASIMIALSLYTYPVSDINKSVDVHAANINAKDNYDHEDIDATNELHTIDNEFDVSPTEEIVEEYEVAVEDEYVASNADITFSYEYINSDVMPYALVTPSTAETNEKTPLIIFLHGTGDRGINAEKFGSRYIANLMQNWELDGFDAYVMMPHLAGKAYNSTWNAGNTAKRLFTVIDQVVEECNIDTDKIVITGHSLGGYGCLYMAAYNTEYFSAVVPISAYESSANLNKLTDVPIRCYVGSPSHGEDWSTFRFTTNTLKNRFGEDAIFQRDVSHKEIPIVAFTEDLDGNNKSDLVEWMMVQTK